MTKSPNEIADAVLAGKMRLEDMAKDTPTYYSFWVEDYMTLVGQGAIAGRTHERLSQADMRRRIYQKDLGAGASRLRRRPSPEAVDDTKGAGRPKCGRSPSAKGYLTPLTHEFMPNEARNLPAVVLAYYDMNSFDLMRECVRVVVQGALLWLHTTFIPF